MATPETSAKKEEAPWPVPRVGVAALLVRPKDGDSKSSRAGMLKASDVLTLIGTRKGSHGAGTMALPGGHLEATEGWADTASRELAEETGIVTPPEAWYPVFFSNDVMEDSRKHYITIFMECDTRLLPGGPSAVADPRTMEPEKCEGWAWTSFEALQAEPKSRLFLPMIHFLEAVSSGAYRPGQAIGSVHSSGSAATTRTV
mmetsp:Transcript_3241/g.4393  ORF Transcript_3241/g.4393 Transcript_3241/m.4393 type:complete len:201 (-) Transcript_3241:72-674(-)